MAAITHPWALRTSIRSFTGCVASVATPRSPTPPPPTGTGAPVTTSSVAQQLPHVSETSRCEHIPSTVITAPESFVPAYDPTGVKQMPQISAHPQPATTTTADLRKRKRTAEADVSAATAATAQHLRQWSEQGQQCCGVPTDGKNNLGASRSIAAHADVDSDVAGHSAEQARLLEEVYAKAGISRTCRQPKLELALDDCSGASAMLGLDFLASAHFAEHYFEQWPLLLRRRTQQTSENRGSNHTVLSQLQRLASLGLKRLTDLGEFVVGMDKREAHHRNVWLLGSSFDAPHPGRKIGRRMQSDELAADVAAGWTAVFDGAQLFLPEIAELVLALSRVFDRRGLQCAMEAHNDLQCTCIFQLDGSKTWELWRNPAVLGASVPADVVGKSPVLRLDRTRLGPPTLRATLKPGDILYIPRGCIHATSTASEFGSLTAANSVHVTAGLEPDLLPTTALMSNASELGQILASAAAQVSDIKLIARTGNAAGKIVRTPPTSLLRIHETPSPQATTALARWAHDVRTVLRSVVDNAIAGNQFVPAILARHARDVELWQTVVGCILTKSQVDPHKDERRMLWMSLALRELRREPCVNATSGRCASDVDSRVGDVGHDNGAEPFATIEEAELVARQFWSVPNP